MLTGCQQARNSSGKREKPNLMEKVPYTSNDPLSINVSFWCENKHFHTAFMLCPECKHYPCRQISQKDQIMLALSPLMNIVDAFFVKRRIDKMYIAKKLDGSLEIIEELNEKDPDPEKLRDVEEIYVINKILVPVLTLKPKPKEERENIITNAKFGSENNNIQEKISDSPKKTKS